MGAGSLGFDCGLICTKDSGNHNDFSTSEPTMNMFVLGFWKKKRNKNVLQSLLQFRCR